MAFNRTILSLVLLCAFARLGLCGSASDLRLVPFPKQVVLTKGVLKINPQTQIATSGMSEATRAGLDLKQELERDGLATCNFFYLGAVDEEHKWVLSMSAGHVNSAQFKSALGTLPAQNESYKLVITPKFAAVGARTEAGLAWGARTLLQLVRANATGHTLPCMTIVDYPSLRYRGYQDDITRGPNPTLNTLEREVRMDSLLKMNFFTFYLEHQYAFKKHPVIGPKDGSLKPEELKKLVAYSKDYGVEIVGGQQSFGHFYHILKHPEFADLRETEHILDPTNEKSYQLLDDMYSEQAPLLESKLFNISCDETYGLGKGPSKALVEKIGLGGVYAGHIKRVHDILKDKYGKRIMMWGDIILQHPENLKDIPKDTIMLSWGYHPAESFESVITPFANSGYEFFVCPGVNCWSRILPDFNAAVINIHNYVRDGAKLGALGMLNTTWDDDGENLFHYNWHGIAWGAECAWSASATPIEDFNRRIGAVLFGEKGDHFGQAIELLGKAESLPGYGRMGDGRFWQGDFGDLPMDKKSALDQANALLQVVEPALMHLRAAQKDAKTNGDILDYFIFGADRMKLIADRQIGYLDAADDYEQAAANGGNAEASVQKAIKIVKSLRDRLVATKWQYRRLWFRENRPYALDWVMGRYDKYIGEYDKRIAKLQDALTAAREGRALPSAQDVGLGIVEKGKG